MVKKSYIIEGGIYQDDRGELIYFNDFDMSNVKRFYQIRSSNLPYSNSQVRAWQGHKIEEKYFYVNQGKFLIAAVKIDDWQKPSKKLKVETYILHSGSPQILRIPAGYANGIMAIEADSVITVYSTLSLAESLKDDYRFDKSWWVNWEREWHADKTRTIEMIKNG